MEEWINEVAAEEIKIIDAAVEVKQSFKKRSDDWFLLLDDVAKETAYISPGTNCHQLFT